jgi:hypothetical protein
VAACSLTPFHCTVDTKTTIVVSFNIDKTLFAIKQRLGNIQVALYILSSKHFAHASGDFVSNVQYRQLVIHSFDFEVRYIS